MEEPSVLDYLKSKLFPWKGPAVEIPEAVSERTEEEIVIPVEVEAARREAMPVARPLIIHWPWRSLLALGLALFAQLSLEPSPERTWITGLIVYGVAFSWLVWADLRGEWKNAPFAEDKPRADPLTLRSSMLLLSAPVTLLAFLALGGNRFNTLNLFLWGLAIALVIGALWLGAPQSRNLWQRLRALTSPSNWKVSLSPHVLGVVAILALALFFRASQLDQIPPEMNSDHAEKLLDVVDVINGEWSIFFPRNTGREAFQFYLTAAVAQIFGSGISFLSLKIGTVLCSLLTLPFIYLLGKELGNRRVGILAVIFTSIAYWPNVITRLALRFTLYPFFVAPTLYFLVRGLRTSNRNDFLLAGLSLGIGLHTYTPVRILPFLIVIAVGLFLLHRHSNGIRRETILKLFLLALVALIVFLPLLRYAAQYPEMFAYRAFTRMVDWERPLPGPAWMIFIQNLWNAMVMFAWDNGEVWTVSIPHRPALDVISASLFYLGLVLVVLRYLRQRHWADLFLVISIPMLMLPSILSLAFPAENPVLSRTSGAIIPVFIVIGLALDGLLTTLENKLGMPAGRRAAWGAALALLGLSALQNYDLVFDQYRRSYELSSWNTSEMGAVIRGFSESVGSPEDAWVMGFPHWVDTRLVGITSGYPRRDYAMFIENLAVTLERSGAKLFLVKPEDQTAQDALQQLYPTGWFQYYTSKVNKDFLIFMTPPGEQGSYPSLAPASEGEAGPSP